MIYLLPGMGATSEMYGEPWQKVDGLCLVDWPNYQGESTLGQLAERLIDTYGMTSDDEVGGSSLGGMVACVIAERCQMQSVYLLGSAKSPGEVHSFLKYFHGAVKITPIDWVQRLVGKRDELLIKMFMQTDPQFIKAMCLAVFQWQGLQSKSIEVKRIHGKRDLVIPLPKDVDRVVNGGHLIAMTRAEECIQYLQQLRSQPLNFNL